MKTILSILFLTIYLNGLGQDTSYVVSKDSSRQLYYTRSLPLDTNQFNFDQYDFFDWKILKPSVNKNSYSIDVHMFYLIDTSGYVIESTLEVFRIGGTEIINSEYKEKIIEETKNIFVNLPKLTYLLRETDPTKTKYLSKIKFRKCR